jgi:broad specificity phosphatase PhoE
MEIVLVRHGKPEGSVNPVVTAAGFAQWIRQYNRSSIRPDSLPPGRLAGAFDEYFVVSSDLPRSRHSAELCAGRTPDLSLTVLREMEIPRFRLPVRMRAAAWIYVSRTIWMLGGRGPFESFREAKVRARRAARRLDRLSLTHDRIVVFGHSFMNRYLGRQLLALGWRGDRPGWAPHWGAARYEKAAAVAGALRAPGGLAPH